MHLSLVLLLLCSGSVLAQKYEFAPTFGYMRPNRSLLGSLPDNTDQKDDDTRLKIGPAFGGRVTWNTKGYYGFEGMFLRNRPVISARISRSGATAVRREDRINVDYIAFNPICYFMPAGERWRPFITAGLQTQKYGEPNILEWTEGSMRTYGGNFGGGIKVMLMKNALFRLDVRDYLGGKPYDLKYQDDRRFGGGILHTIEATVGISIAF
jgi:hypothetical protein